MPHGIGDRVGAFTPGAKAELAGLMRVGKVTTATSVTEFASTDLIGQDDDAFDGWYVSVLQADNAAPEGEMKPMSDYISSTGTITHTAFSAQLAVGDWVVLLRPEIAVIGAFDTAAATGAVDTATTLMGYAKQLVTDLRTLTSAAGVINNVLTPTAGVHFWVDKDNGSDSNGGLSSDDPVLTITYALSLCTSGRYDVIHIMANSPSAPPGTETFPINVNKAGVTIIGEHGKGLLSDSGIGCNAQNTATFLIAANFVTIEDMYIGCDQLGTNGGLIEFTSNTWSTTFRKCLFDTQYIAAYGILATNDQPYLLVEDCVFGGTWIAGYTTAGIYIGNLTGGMLRRNVFNKIQGIGISAGLNAGSFQILDNEFNLPSNTVGKAITLADGSFGIFVDDNRANFGMTAMALNPYRDLNNDNSNTWGLNYKAGVSIMPIGT